MLRSFGQAFTRYHGHLDDVHEKIAVICTIFRSDYQLIWEFH